MANWSATGAIAGVAMVLVVVGGAVARMGKTWLADRRAAHTRLDRLEIRLFGLPADPETGARKVDGEFDRIDRRLNALPDEILRALRNGNH